jgi:glycerol-3-phosphate dehydrogenase (NAD(P)+)
LSNILADMHMVAEGVRSAESVLALAARFGVEMPIAEQVDAVVGGRTTPAEAVRNLMLRQAKAELEGIVPLA